MQTPHFLGISLALLTPLALTAACGDSTPAPPASTGGSSASGGTPSSGGQNLGGELQGSGGKANTGGSTSPPEGGAPSLGGMGGLGGMLPMIEVPPFEGEAPCASDKECTGQGMLCNTELRVCVQCFEDTDCSDSEACESGSCMPVTTCENSLGCSTDQVCVKEGGAEQGLCQECGMDADCTGGGSCVSGTCRASCDTDKDCTPQGMLCHTDAGVCISCLAHTDCGSSQVCEQGECKASVCTPSARQCLDNALVTCREDGRGYLEPVDCGDATCGQRGDSVACLEGPGQDDGVVIYQEDFSMGTGRWSVSAGNPNGPPEIRDGAACVEQPGFTFGWPVEGNGIDLEPGSYTLSFSTRTNSQPGVEAKVAAADEPWQPVYFSTQDFDVGQQNQHSFTFTVSEAGENVGLAFNVWNNEGRLCWDNIKLTVN